MLRWPGPSEVIPPLEEWASRLGRERPDVVGVALIGSYARGDWGVGSDADLLVEVDGEPPAVEARAASFPAPSGPVPVDIIVLTSVELAALRAERRRFALMTDREARWLYRRD